MHKHEHSRAGGEWRFDRREPLDGQWPADDHAGQPRDLTAIAARTFYVATALAAAIGGLALSGWIFNIQMLKSLHPAWATMKVNTALALLLAAVGLWCLHDERAPLGRRRLGQGLGACVGLIGMLTVCEFVFGWDSGIDQWLVRELPGGVGTLYPGRMAPLTAVGMGLIGSALILLGTGRRGAQAAQVLALMIVALVHLGLTGYALKALALYRWLNGTVAFHSLLGLGALVAAILCARPRTPLMTTVLSPEAGGMLARRLLPAALVVPLLVGVARIRGEQAGYYETAAGVAIMVLSISFAMVALTGWTAHILNQAAAERRAAEKLMRQGERDFSEAFAHAPIGMVLNDLEGRFLQVNAAYCDIIGFDAEELHRPDFDFMRITHPEDRGHNAAEYRRLRAGEIPAFFVEKRYIRKDGGIVWVRVSASLRRDAEGRPLHIVGLVEDISERKRSEQLLKEQNRMLELVAAGRPREECLSALTESVARLQPRCAAAVVLADEAREAIKDTISAQIPASFGQGIAGARIDNMATGSCPRAIFEGVRVIIPNIAADARLDPGWRALCDAHGIRSAHSTPIFPRDGAANAAFFIARGEAGSPDDWELRLADFGARIASIVLERDRVNASLRKSEERFRSVMDNMSEGLMLFDSNCNLIYQNPASLRIHGFEPQNDGRIGRQDLPETWEAWNDQGRPVPFEEWPVSRVFRQERFQDQVLHVRRVETGQAFYGSYNGSPISDADGKLALGFITIREITRQKQAEEAARNREALLNAIVDCLPVGLLIFDAGGKLARLNRAIAKIWGEPPETMKLQDYGQWLGYWPETGQRLKPDEWPCARAMQTGKPVSELLEIEQFNTGQHRFELVNAAPVLDANGQIIGGVAVQVDITERKRAEEELRALKDELEIRVGQRTAELAAANKELEAFGYTVSHDLCTPLRHITSFIQLLSMDEAERLSDQGRDYLRTINESALRMSQLIDDLLAFSRLGRAAMAEKPVSLSQLVEAVRQELEPAARDRAIEWRIGPLPEVRGDPTLLRNAVTNLLANAIKYSRKRDPAVIEVGAEARDGEAVCFVRDNGAGFDMRFADKLFGVFQRLHPAEVFEGTGIGLASVRRIIERHGGRVWAEGEVDQGATFYFAIPQKEN